MVTRILIVTTICLIAMAPAYGQEAKVFNIPLDQATDILLDQDHMTVSLQQGWVSKHDSFLKNLFSKPSKLAISIDGTIQYFDHDTSTYSKLLENSDIRPNMNRPWGAVLNLIDAVPADSNANFVFKIAVYNDDRLSKILNAAKGAEPAGMTTQIDLWVGYGNLLCALLTNIFDTNKTNYPFLLNFDVKAAGLPTKDRMKEHYEVAIAPNKDGDPFVVNVDVDKLRYNEYSRSLYYDGKPVEDHSYAVLKVAKAAAPDINQLILDSKAPWAVLATTQFLGISTLDVQNKDQILVLAKNQLTQLKTELDLLKNEHRFSKYDRAGALVDFADESKNSVMQACKGHNVTTAECPTSDLDQFIGQIRRSFGLPNNAILPTTNRVKFKMLREELLTK